MNKKDTRRDIVLEQKAQEVTSLMFTLCEERIKTAHNNPTHRLIALAASALAVQKAIEAFMAIERICD